MWDSPWFMIIVILYFQITSFISNPFHQFFTTVFPSFPVDMVVSQGKIWEQLGSVDHAPLRNLVCSDVSHGYWGSDLELDMMECNSLLAIRSPVKSSDFTGSLFDSLGLNIGILFNNTKIASPFILSSWNHYRNYTQWTMYWIPEFQKYEKSESVSTRLRWTSWCKNWREIHDCQAWFAYWGQGVIHGDSIIPLWTRVDKTKVMRV